MAQQFSTKYDGLLTPQSSPAPQASEKMIMATPPSSPPTGDSPTHSNTPLLAPKKVYSPTRDNTFPPTPSFEYLPRLIPNDTSTVRGRVVIFNTLTNRFSLRNVGPTTTLRSIVLTSPRYRIHQMQIRSFESKVDLGEAGVKVGEGRVDDVMKWLPGKVVTMRVFGLYQTLYIVRSAEAVDEWRAKLDIALSGHADVV